MSDLLWNGLTLGFFAAALLALAAADRGRPREPRR